MRINGPTHHSVTPPTPACLASSRPSQASGEPFSASDVTSTPAMFSHTSSIAANTPSQFSTTCHYHSSASTRVPSLRLCSSSAHLSTPCTAHSGIWSWTGACLTPPANRNAFSEIHLHTNKFGCTIQPSSLTQFSASTGSCMPSTLTTSSTLPFSPSSYPSPKYCAVACGCYSASRTNTAQTLVDSEPVETSHFPMKFSSLRQPAYKITNHNVSETLATKEDRVPISRARRRRRKRRPRRTWKHKL